MVSNSVTILDYGIGNILSVSRGFEAIGAKVILASNIEGIYDAERLILPGVGAFAKGIEQLKKNNFDEAIIDVANHGKPLLGICLGMQFLMDSSEEFGNTNGLGLIPGKVIPIPPQDIAGESLIVPHIGWNALETSFNKSWDNTLLANTPLKSNVYFVHSFFSKPNDDNHLLAHCIYGGNDLSAVISKDNVMGCQFHPEKSGEIGLNILKTFLSI
jgi:glutamine amidotransferase|tara:strand:+ start:944 stop:1588 length:645 start_codon:yes stop_codon:yes gene_type:complete